MRVRKPIPVLSYAGESPSLRRKLQYTRIYWMLGITLALLGAMDAYAVLRAFASTNTVLVMGAVPFALSKMGPAVVTSVACATKGGRYGIYGMIATTLFYVSSVTYQFLILT